MQRLTLKLQPTDGSFPVPLSTGYQTYSALLSVLSETGLAQDVHDTPFASLTNSGLLGSFGANANRNHHQIVKDHPDVEYDLHLGICHPDDEELFEALVRAFVMENRPLPLAHGEMEVQGLRSEQTTQTDLLEEAAATVDDGVTSVHMEFVTPTCRQRYGEVYDAYPDRVSVFQELARRWNGKLDGESDLQLTPTAEALGAEMYPRMDPASYRTHSIVVHRREPTATDETDEEATVATDGAGNGEHLTQAQGFTGQWSLGFKQASEATKTAVVTLARFAEFAGIGKHTARGAGTVETNIEVP